ncbi:hypothetical protein R3P38DRAFT_2826394 [Favolaschia claudopus]|uniref:Uncharacterized protein n=1 Tax=Favolaschia claudopus TaxID=2862362 RepID=A0AAW0EHA1_9AGAR
MRRLQSLIQELNDEVYNPAGLNILWPRKVAFLFVTDGSTLTHSFADGNRILCEFHVSYPPYHPNH